MGSLKSDRRLFRTEFLLSQVSSPKIYVVSSTDWVHHNRYVILVLYFRCIISHIECRSVQLVHQRAKVKAAPNRFAETDDDPPVFICK